MYGFDAYEALDHYWGEPCPYLEQLIVHAQERRDWLRADQLQRLLEAAAIRT